MYVYMSQFAFIIPALLGNCENKSCIEVKIPVKGITYIISNTTGLTSLNTMRSQNC